MFSCEGVMEDIPLDLIIIPVPRQSLRSDRSMKQRRELLSRCQVSVNELMIRLDSIC